MGAIDFTTFEVWTRGGLVMFYLLFVMEVATRRDHFAGCTPKPQEAWMKPIARNLTDPFDGFLNESCYLLMDRDTKFSAAFRELLKCSDVRCVRLPARSPNLSPHIERFMRSVQEECLDRMAFLGGASLRNAVREFLAHDHRERNHQGLSNQVIEASEELSRTRGEVGCRARLGGLLRYYYREAA